MTHREFFSRLIILLEKLIVIPGWADQEFSCEMMGFQHTWVIESTVLTCIPPKTIRHCANCGRRETGTPQDSMVWQ